MTKLCVTCEHFNYSEIEGRDVCTRPFGRCGLAYSECYKERKKIDKNCTTCANYTYSESEGIYVCTQPIKRCESMENKCYEERHK